MEFKFKEFSEVQEKLNQAVLKLDSMDQKIEEAESSLAHLGERNSALNEENETVETKLAEKNELLDRIEKLEKFGFNMEMLGQLQDTLMEMGAKHGLKAKQAITKFFSDLQDYDTTVGFEREIQRLETITETKKLEAEKWQAEANSLSRRHKDLTEAIAAVQNLGRQGVKTEQVVSWNAIIDKLGGPEGLQGKLVKYKSISELLDAKKMEMEDCGTKVTELSTQVKVLNKQKVEIEGAIKSLSNSGLPRHQSASMLRLWVRSIVV